MPNRSERDFVDSTARLMLVGVSLAWGLSWPAMRLALNEIPPFSMRVGTTGLATLTLFALAFLQHRNLAHQARHHRACMSWSPAA